MIMIMTMMWSHGFVFSIICICVVPWILGSKQMISRSGKYKSECRIVKCFRPLRFPPERRLNVFTKNIPDTWKIIISFRRVCHDGWWFRDSHTVFLISPNFTPDADLPRCEPCQMETSLRGSARLLHDAMLVSADEIRFIPNSSPVKLLQPG